MGVTDYICQYMFETPPHLSNRMDLAKMLAKIELAEGQAVPGFRLLRQTRTGLMSYPVNTAAARAQLSASVYLQMALKPDIVHVVSYSEADHAATADDVIESCRMAQHVIELALRDIPDMTADPVVQRRRDALVEDALVIVDAIRQLGAGKAADPLLDPDVLTRAVEIGLLDAPHLQGNPHACGRVRTRIVDGANLPVDEHGKVLSEAERVKRILEEL
jgi:glutamate mutase epsilon subunit